MANRAGYNLFGLLWFSSTVACVELLGWGTVIVEGPYVEEREEWERPIERDNVREREREARRERKSE